MYVKLSQPLIHRDDFVVHLLHLTADNLPGEAGSVHDAQDPSLLWWIHPKVKAFLVFNILEKNEGTAVWLFSDCLLFLFEFNLSMQTPR